MTQKIGPNDPCHCGSGKKYKKCYGLPDKYQNTCMIFLKENMDDNVKHIQNFIDDSTNEISNSILYLNKCKTPTLRAQLIILFAFIEAMAKIRSCFVYGKPLDQDKKVVLEWFDKFICIKENKSWTNQLNLKLLNGDMFYKLRCSLSHKLAIPNLSFHGKNIMINSNSNSKYAKALATGIKGTILITPLEISTAIFEATKLMIDEINLKKDDSEYQKQIQDLSNYLYSEGAVLIKMD